MNTLDFSSPLWMLLPVIWIFFWLVLLLLDRQKGMARVVSVIVYIVAAVVGAWLMTLIPRLIS